MASRLAMSTEPYEILLYYKYVSFPDPPAYFEAHKNLCSELDLRGRILIAKEGINGTVSGPVSATTAYRNHLDNDPLTSGIAWKIDPADGHAFPKMSVKFRKEVVTLGLGEDDFSPEEITATHLSPPEWREAHER